MDLSTRRLADAGTAERAPQPRGEFTLAQAQLTGRGAQAGFRTYEAGLFGGRVSAVPSERDAKGGANWVVNWSGPEGSFSTEARLSGQFGPEQLTDGSFGKNRIGAHVLGVRARAIPSSVSEDSFRNVGMDRASAPLANEFYGSMRAQGHSIGQSWNRVWQAYTGGYASGGPEGGRRALTGTVVNAPSANLVGSRPVEAKTAAIGEPFDVQPFGDRARIYQVRNGNGNYELRLRLNEPEQYRQSDFLVFENAGRRIDMRQDYSQRLADGIGPIPNPFRTVGSPVFDKLNGTLRQALDADNRAPAGASSGTPMSDDWAVRFWRGAGGAVRALTGDTAEFMARVAPYMGAGMGAFPVTQQALEGQRLNQKVAAENSNAAGSAIRDANDALGFAMGVPPDSPEVTAGRIMMGVAEGVEGIFGLARGALALARGAGPAAGVNGMRRALDRADIKLVVKNDEILNRLRNPGGELNRVVSFVDGISPDEYAVMPTSMTRAMREGLGANKSVPGVDRALARLDDLSAAAPRAGITPSVTPPPGAALARIPTGPDFSADLGTRFGKTIGQSLEGGVYVARLGDDPKPLLTSQRPMTGADFRQGPGKQALDARDPAAAGNVAPRNAGNGGSSAIVPASQTRLGGVSIDAFERGVSPTAPPPAKAASPSDGGGSSAIVRSSQTGKVDSLSGTKIEAFERGIPPVDPSDVQVGRTRAVPATPNPATPQRMADALRAAYPDAEVRLIDEGRIAEMTFTSGKGDKAEVRKAFVGNYQDIRAHNPELARAANEYMPKRSVLYEGRSPESVDQVFEGTDITVIIAGADGKPKGMANLTYQTAVFGTGDDTTMKPVLYLAQVAGEKGGGSQATNILHAIAKDEGVSMTASAFPGNVRGRPNAAFPEGRPGLYDLEKPAGGNPAPDAMIAWQSPHLGNELDAKGVPNPPRVSLNPDRFGPDQLSKTNGGGQQLFVPLDPFPIEPHVLNLGTAHGRPLTQSHEAGIYSVHWGDDPNPIARSDRAYSIAQFEQPGSRLRQDLDARAKAAGLATDDPALAFVPEADPTVHPGTSSPNAHRVKYMWLYGAADPNNLTVDDIPKFAYLDDRLGDQSIRHKYDPSQPDTPGNPNRNTGVFYQPYPKQNPADATGPQSSINGGSGSSPRTILSKGDPNAPVVSSADGAKPRLPSNIDELAPPIIGENGGKPVTNFSGNLNPPTIKSAADIVPRFPTEPNRISIFGNNGLSNDNSSPLPLFGAAANGVPANDGPMINSAADMQARMPGNLNELKKLPDMLNDLPADLQDEAALLSAQTGMPFMKQLDNGRNAFVQYVGDTWRPIADFKNDVVTGAKDATLAAWDSIPAPARKGIETTGVVLGAVADPVGTAFGAGVNKFGQFLETPKGQALSAPLRNAAGRAGEAWEALAEHPQGKHLVGAWNNSLGHPGVPALLGKFTQGSGKAVQTLANGGLGLLAAGIATGETEFGTFKSAKPSELPPEHASIYRQIAGVPRGVDIHYATVDIPGTPNGRVTIWTAAMPGMALRPGLPGEPGTAQPTVASTRNRDGRPEFMGWVNFVAGGPTMYGGLNVHLTDNIGVQRSVYGQLGSGVLQTPVGRASTSVGPYRFNPDRQAPVAEPTIVGSLAATRFGVTDELRFVVPLGDNVIPVNILTTRMRTPIRPTTVGTIVNQDATTGKFGIHPQGSLDFNAKPGPAGLTVYGTQGGFNPDADDLGQIRQILTNMFGSNPEATDAP